MLYLRKDLVTLVCKALQLSCHVCQSISLDTYCKNVQRKTGHTKLRKAINLGQ